MAVVNSKSTRVSNADAAVQTLSSVVVQHGRKRSSVATFEAVNGDSIGSTYRMHRVHSSWRISKVLLYCDAITTCTADLGLYNVPGRGSAAGTVVSATTYATAQSLAAAITVSPVNIAFEAKDIALAERQVWQDAVAARDLGYWYDLVLTLTAAAGSAGTITLELEYIAND